MRRSLMIVAAAGLMSGCGGQSAKVHTTQLDLALSDMKRLEPLTDAPEATLATVWARQDARAVANCETTRLRLKEPQSREAAIIGAAMDRDLPFEDFYAGALKAGLRSRAAARNEDCRKVVKQFDRRIMRREEQPDGSIQMLVAIHNVYDDAEGAAALDKAATAARQRGDSYRYTLVKEGPAWKISELDKWDGKAFVPVYPPLKPLVETSGM